MVRWRKDEHGGQTWEAKISVERIFRYDMWKEGI